MDEHHLQRLLRSRLTDAELADLNHEAVKTDASLEEVVLRRGLFTHEQIYQQLAANLSMPYVDLDCYLVDSALIGLLDPERARRLRAVPLFRVDSELTLATDRPDDIRSLDELRRVTGLNVSFALATPEAISAALDRYYGNTHGADISDAVVEIEADEALRYLASKEASKSIEEMAGEAPVVRFVNTLLAQAVADRASDIHVEPEPDALRIRTRVDGLLHVHSSLPIRLHPIVTSRIKILANMDISEKRRPQDGRFEFAADHRQIDVRVSSFPTVHGENLVLRLLDRARGLLAFEQMGIAPEDAKRLRMLIQQPHGIILVTGPTGSGKTTTLYSALRELNTPERNLMTLEDPVEYHLPGVRQSQVNPKAGVTFAAGLRAILRQDPDVIMVGEIRDAETATIAFQAALTGHLVLATLHTNDAASGLTRMLDMNIEPFLISSSVTGILAQRLLRTVCDRCRETYTPEPDLLARLGIESDSGFVRGRGCPACANRGYRGRTGLFELLLLSDDIRRAVMQRRSSEEIKELAVDAGMTTLRGDALAKIRAGITTPDEVLRVTQDRLSP